jgi:hypothetical protein
VKLYQMEPLAGPEKPLGIDLGLHDIEKPFQLR